MVKKVYPGGDGLIVYSYLVDGVLHRSDDNPAMIWFNNKGIVNGLYWYQHGHPYRADGPTGIAFNGDGSVSHEEYRDCNNALVMSISYNYGIKRSKKLFVPPGHLASTVMY